MGLFSITFRKMTHIIRHYGINHKKCLRNPEGTDNWNSHELSKSLFLTHSLTVSLVRTKLKTMVDQPPRYKALFDVQVANSLKVLYAFSLCFNTNLIFSSFF